MEDKLQSAADLPYFEGDFWPNVLEESIKELDQEEEEKRKQAEAAEAAANAVRYFSKICRLLEVTVKFVYRSSPCLTREKRDPTARRKGRRKRRRATSPKRTSVRTVKSRIRHRRGMIFRRRFLRPWTSIRKCFLLSGCILFNPLPV